MRAVSGWVANGRGVATVPGEVILPVGAEVLTSPTAATPAANPFGALVTPDTVKGSRAAVRVSHSLDQDQVSVGASEAEHDEVSGCVHKLRTFLGWEWGMHCPAYSPKL